jgi:signal transduction histidine kinase
VRAAEDAVKAAQAQRHPTAGVTADYGDVGTTPNSSHGTFAFTASASLNLFDGRRIRGDIVRDRDGCSVRDNGIGIEAQHNERTFHMFEHPHSSSEYPRYGVGLALAQKIVARHKGRIWLESTHGVGTTCYFSIPQ